MADDHFEESRREMMRAFEQHRREMQQAATEMKASFDTARAEMLAAREEIFSAIDQARREMLGGTMPGPRDLGDFDPDKRQPPTGNGSRRPGKRRRGDGGIEPAPVTPKPKPTPLLGGAEVPVE